MVIRLKTHKFELAKAAWEARGKEMIENIHKAQAQVAEQEKTLVHLRLNLSSKYQIDFNKISYHDITGVIYEHSDADPSPSTKE